MTQSNLITNLCFIVLSTLLLVSCSKISKQNQTQGKDQAPATIAQAKVFVQLFEWGWQDIATECEDFLGPNGYSAVQTSPPQEHITGSQWWTRYQPVSYRIESRNGTRAEFADMVKRCKAAGIDIYADAIINHMAGIFIGKGIAGSDYSQYQYAVPYSYDDFHHCGRNTDDRIADYRDLWEVQTCNLGTLVDLDTANPEVQKKIAAYLNDLLSLGVVGFRIDAAKHIDHKEVAQILAQLDSKPFIFMEVIDKGGEPINARNYMSHGLVTEFKYTAAITEAFKKGQLATLPDMENIPGFLPQDKAVVFIDTHDLQRGHGAGGDTLNYKSGALYDLANVFMLGWPYGYPKVMSSYRFNDSDQGPPLTRPVINGECSSKWLCEHRRPSRTAMVNFRKITAAMPVSNWQVINEQLISFSRGDKGHLLINIGTTAVSSKFITSMKAGDYCNIIAEQTVSNHCKEKLFKVDKDGTLQTSVPPLSAVVIVDP